MIRTLTIAAALVGLAWLVLAMAPGESPVGPELDAAARAKAPPPWPSRAADRGSEADAARTGVPDGGTARADRNVTPQGMTLGPDTVAGLKRIAPRDGDWAPPSPLTDAEDGEAANDATATDGAGSAAADDGSVRQMLLPRPVALDTAHLKIGDATIDLPGIEPLPLDAECGEDAAAWPCGMRARTAFRAFLRSRSIRCAVPADFAAKQQTVASQCTVGGGDIGAWLIRNGWARAAPDGPYAEIETRARQAGRGVWGRAPGQKDRTAAGPESDLRIAPIVAPISATR